MTSNASGRGREDEANNKKCVERIFKKQWSPQSFFPLLFFHVVEAWSFISQKRNRGSLSLRTPYWAPYWKQWNCTAFAYWRFRPQTSSISTQFSEVGSQAENWASFLGIVKEKKILKMLILEIPQDKTPSNHLTVKTRINKPLGMLRTSK